MRCGEGEMRRHTDPGVIALSEGGEVRCSIRNDGVVRGGEEKKENKREKEPIKKPIC